MLPFTPRHLNLFYFYLVILFIGLPAGHAPNLVPRSPHSMPSSTVPCLVYAPTPPRFFVYLSTDDLEPVSAESERRLKANLPKVRRPCRTAIPFPLTFGGVADVQSPQSGDSVTGDSPLPSVPPRQDPWHRLTLLTPAFSSTSSTNRETRAQTRIS